MSVGSGDMNRRTVPRRLDLAPDLRHRSVFLFGPRQTGKTTYLSALFPHSPVFNLLRGEVFLRLSREPGRLRQELATVSRSSAPVIIDEIQKLPSLLDEVHDLIESRGLQFSYWPPAVPPSCAEAGSTCSAAVPGHAACSRSSRRKFRTGT